MSNTITDKFIERHYSLVTPEKRLIRWVWQEAITSKHHMEEGKSAIIAFENTTENNLEIITLDQSEWNYTIDLKPKHFSMKNYKGSKTTKNYPNAFHLQLLPNSKLDEKYRISTPLTIFATFFGETANLDKSELDYYNEIIGISLPVDFVIKQTFSLGAPIQDKKSEAKFKDLIEHWLSIKTSNVRIYDKFRNGPLQYHFRDNKENYINFT